MYTQGYVQIFGGDTYLQVHYLECRKGGKNNLLITTEGERKWLRVTTNCWAFVLAVLNSLPLLHHCRVNYKCEKGTD